MRAAVLAALLAFAGAPAVAQADVSSQEAMQIVRQLPAARTLLLTHPRATLQRAGRGQRLARDRAPGLSRARRSRAGSSIARAGEVTRPFADGEHPAPRGHGGDPHRAARPQGRRLGAALQGAHPVRDASTPTFHTWTVHVNAGAALRRDRAGRDRRPHRQGAARLDGPAGELDDGARLQGLVRAQAQRHAPLARLLRGLPDRARRLAAHLDAAHARPRRPALVLGLALVLRARPRVLGRAAAVPADGLPDRAPDLDRPRGAPAAGAAPAGCRPGRWRRWRCS